MFKANITKSKNYIALLLKSYLNWFQVNMARMKIYYKVLYYVNRTIQCFKISSENRTF